MICVPAEATMSNAISVVNAFSISSVMVFTRKIKLKDHRGLTK
jgi:hypothetical protein